MNQNGEYGKKEHQKIKDYPMEELLALVENLAGRYTGRTSTSVTYETAQMLMEAVIYCLEEYRTDRLEHSGYGMGEGGTASVVPVRDNEFTLKEAYDRGYRLVLKKTQMARQLYHRILQNFEDYGCLNYSETIKKGMPEFFRRYDARFRPQDHLLILDYPVLQPLGKMCGVDAVYGYLQNIRLESRFLAAFSPAVVEGLLEEIQPGYRELFLDNICSAVLERSLWCMIAGRPVAQLRLESGDMEAVRDFFLNPEEERLLSQESDGQQPDGAARLTERAEVKLNLLITRLVDAVFGGDELLKEYLIPQGKEYASRLNLHKTAPQAFRDRSGWK